MSCAINPIPMAHQWRKEPAPLLRCACSKNQWRKSCAIRFFLTAHQWRTSRQKHYQYQHGNSRLDELIPLAARDEFTLFERKGRSTEQWRSLKLIRAGGEQRKHNWWLGWNGERLARGKDRRDLAKRYPDVMSWLIASLAAEADTRGTRPNESGGSPCDRMGSAALTGPAPVEIRI